MSPTLITSARLVRPGEPSLEDAAVVVDGDALRWVGGRPDVPAEYAHARHVDLGDATLLPGLIDAHVHLSLSGDEDAAQFEIMLGAARDLVEAGVTTARDLGGRTSLTLRARDLVATGGAPGPRLLVAGAPLTPLRGHCWYLGGEVDGDEEARALIRSHVVSGVDVIKVMATGGFLTPGTTPWDASFEVATLRAIVEESHRFGRRVAAHCHGVEGIRRAVAAGVDTLEHCSFAEEDGLGDLDERLLSAIVASGAYVSPTMNADARTLLERGWQPPVIELWRRGARVIASTDAGIPGTPHGDYALALESLVAAGMPAADVLLAATVTAAEALGLGDVTGRVAPGFAADLVAVDGDPRLDLSVLRRPLFVMARGRVIVSRA